MRAQRDPISAYHHLHLTEQMGSSPQADCVIGSDPTAMDQQRLLLAAPLDHTISPSTAFGK
jgi:hypothetical protein